MGYLLALSAAALFACAGVIAKLAFETGLAPSELVQLRQTGGFLLLFVLLVVFYRRALLVPVRELPLLFLYGIVGIGALNLAYYEAISRVPLGVALVIQYTATLMLLGVARLMGRRVDRRLWIAALVTLAGSYLVVGAYDESLRAVNAVGAGIAFLSAMIFTGYYLLGERILKRTGPLTLLVYGLSSAALAWVLIRPPDRVPWDKAGAAWPFVVGVVVVGTVVPYLLTLAAQRRLPATRVGLTSTFEPVVAVLVAYVVLGELLAAPQLVGGALVLAGIGLAQSLRVTEGSA